jgi:hypothetical protein
VTVGPGPWLGRPLAAERPHADGGPWLVLAVLCLGSAALIVVLGERLTFFNDDWYFLLQRPGLASHGGLDTLLEPHNGNMVVLLVLVYKVILAVFGMHSQLPFRLLLALAASGLGVVVYLLASERVGPVLGLVAAAVVLFLGPAWEVLLFFAGINHLVALTLGLAALYLLQVDSPRRNAGAGLLLVAAVSVSVTGLALVAGAAIAVAMRRRPQQLWIPALPVIVFGVWWLFYGHKEHSGVTVGHVVHLPRYLYDSLSAGLASITGLVHPALPDLISSGHLLAVLALLALLAWLVRGGRPGPWAYVFGGAAIAFWLLTGASAIQGRGAIASRYRLTDGALLLVLGAELFKRARVRGHSAMVISLLAVAVVASNIWTLRGGFGFMRAQARLTEADLGGLEIAGSRSPANLQLLQIISGTPYLTGVTSGRYFAQTARYGTPAFDTPRQLAHDPAAQQRAADGVLVSAYALNPQPSSPARTPRSCPRILPRTAASTPSLPLSVGDTTVKNLSHVPLVVSLARFAPVALSRNVGFLPGESAARLRVPRDTVSRPWRVSFLNPQPAAGVRVAVCPG